MLRNNLLALEFPLNPVSQGIIQIFVPCNSKKTTGSEPLFQRKEIKVELSKLALVPTFGRINLGTAREANLLR
jgi:hypothetical protein